MTEMCSVHISWDQYDPLPESRRGTFGKTLPGIAHKVVDPDTLEEVPAGTDGELWVRGYSLMQGLHRREREEVFEPDGWYRTGDAGHFDDDGWFYFTGRLGEMIKTPGGANVAPAEVEAALMAYPDVLEAYVTGIPADGDGRARGRRGRAARRRRRIDGDELRAPAQGRPLGVQGAQAPLGVREVGAPVPRSRARSRSRSWPNSSRPARTCDRSRPTS